MIGYGQFLKDPHYLVRMNVRRITLTVIVLIGALLLRPTDPLTLLFYAPCIYFAARGGLELTLVGLAIGIGTFLLLGGTPSLLGLGAMAVAILTTPLLTASYHGASHNSMKPRWLNRMIGEIIGTWHLQGLDEWSAVHALHHRHADHKTLDPHPPGERSFKNFLNGYSKNIGSVLGAHVVQVHGADALKIHKKMGLLVIARQLLTTITWFIILGPELFVFLFATNAAAKKFLYGLFNYVTHITVDGETKIVDIDRGIYKFINLIGFNTFLHKVHHENPQLFRPTLDRATK